MTGIDDKNGNDTSDHENDTSDHEEEIDVESPDEVELSPRTRNPPGYLKDYVIGREAEEDKLQNRFALFNTSSNPNTFEEASKMKVLREAMKQEIDSIESYNTWELTDLPAGCKKIGVKWIYKTKLNEKGEFRGTKPDWLLRDMLKSLDLTTMKCLHQ